DDLTFDGNGAAGLGGTTLGSAQRDGRYSYAYLMRHPKSHSQAAVDVAIVIYSGRVFSPSTETVYSVVTSTQTGNSVNLDYTNKERPAVRRGTWLLDVTAHNPMTDTANALQYGPVHGDFYRVVNVTDASATQVTVELEPTIKVPTTTPITDVVVMENVV